MDAGYHFLWSRTLKHVFGAIEEGAEMLVMSVIVWYVLRFAPYLGDAFGKPQD